jgi:branched-subunit amino acid aminotransferase/4-amino-4-deoxychorismate lyase
MQDHVHDVVFVLDGAAIAEGPATPVFSPGLSFALSAFDTAYGPAPLPGATRRFFRLEDHLDRLAASAAALGLGTLPPRDRLAAWANDAAARLPREADVHLRIAAFGENADGRLLSPIRTRIAMKASARPLPPLEARARACILSSWRKPAPQAAPAGVKAAAHYAFVRAILAEAAAAGADTALLLSAGGQLAEGPAANVFACIDGAVLTPPLSANILGGITRRTLLERGPGAGLPVREAEIAPADLARASEVFFASTGQAIEPVRALDGRPLPGARGPLTRRAEAIYRAALREDRRAP